MSLKLATRVATPRLSLAELREQNRELREQNTRLLEQGRSLTERCRILANAEETLRRVNADCDAWRLRLVEQRNTLEAAETRANDADKHAKEMACEFGLLEGHHTLVTQLVTMLWWAESKQKK